MNVRWIDRVAFWGIKSLLTRSPYQKFNRRELDRFMKQWRGKSLDEFYFMDFGRMDKDKVFQQIRALSIPSCTQIQLKSPAPCDFEENNQIWVELHLAHPLSKAPIFFVQHGWRSVSVRGYHKMCKGLNQLGVNAGILHLPYHFSRKPSGSFSGELAICSDVVRSAYSLRQGVLDVCWLKNLMKELGVPYVGLWGTSYGGWISAMAVALDDGFDAALLLEPPIEIEELFWEIPLFSNLQQELNRLQISRESMGELFQLVTPYHHPLRIKPEHVLILGSQHDLIGYPDSLRKLHQAWPGSYLEIFPYGHISYQLHASAVDRFLKLLAPKLVIH